MRLLLAAAVSALMALPAAAQTPRTGTIVGTVARDTLGAVVAEARVQLPQLNLSATTNAAGEFRFSDVPAGRYAITVRAVGFQPVIDSLDVTAGGQVDADVMLVAGPVNLSAQRTTASAAEKRLPPGLEAMQERMKTHTGGYFVTDSMLRAENDKKLLDVLRKVPSLHQELRANGPGVFLASGREIGDGGPVFERRVDPDSAYGQSFPHGMCYISVFVDGAKYFLGPAAEGNPPPDFGDMWARDYSGIEYYSGASSLPAEYNSAGTHCGLLLLWTRHTP